MKSTDQRFAQYHAANPHVYETLLRLAQRVQNAGFRNYSIWALFARLRWHYDFDVKTADRFKICNDYTSRYARLLMKQEPELAGFFRTKPLKGEREATA